MRYRVTIEGVVREVDVRVGSDGALAVTVDGEPVAIDAVSVPHGVSLRMDGRVVDVAIGGPNNRRQMASGEQRVDATLESDRTTARAARRSGAASTDAVRSPMPGRVVKVLVAPGDRVAASQPVVVVEAMKMENELRALSEATVRSVEVTAGQAVEANAILITFESGDLARSA